MYNLDMLRFDLPIPHGPHINNTSDFYQFLSSSPKLNPLCVGCRLDDFCTSDATN